MSLSSVSLRNIRKHTEARIDFSDKLNYIVGGNGVGKTTILEAIHYLSTTKSCVTSTDSEAVKFGAQDFQLKDILQEEQKMKQRLHILLVIIKNNIY